MSKITTIIFDIDGVLFNHELAEIVSIREILNEKFLLFDFLEEDVVKYWKKVNVFVWHSCNASEMSGDFAKIYRWQLFMRYFDIDISLERAKEISVLFYKLVCNRKYVVPGIEDILKYCKANKITMASITNGFEYVQINKLKECGILDYFKEIITENQSGYRKPDLRMFWFAIDKLNICPDNAFYIGNSLVEDIEPAIKTGIPTIWFDCNGNSINDLSRYPMYTAENINELYLILSKYIPYK